MKTVRLPALLLALIIAGSCTRNDNRSFRLPGQLKQNAIPVNIPVDRGYSEYIESYTSGIIPAKSSIEVRFTPDFAKRADRSASGLFMFQPNIKGKTEWKDSLTLVFTPSKPLDAGKTYTGTLNLGKLGEVKKRLTMFPMRIQTLQKDFRVTTGPLRCESSDGSSYVLAGELTTSDYIDPSEAENYLSARLGRKKMKIEWDHTADLVYNFTIGGIVRNDRQQELTLSWSGPSAGAKQKGSSVFIIPPAGTFSVIDIRPVPGETQKIDVVFSDPVDASMEITGLIHLTPSTALTFNVNSNIISILPATRLQGKVTISIEPSLRNFKDARLASGFKKELDFTSMAPAIEAVGKGVIVPSSKNLLFPFKAVNLKAVDLRIVRIFENNLPYFLQENNINGENSVKRFGRPVYSGRVDLTSGSSMNATGWNLYTVDLADYIDVEPGVLYQVSLGMRKSYSLYPCTETEDDSNYEEALQQAEENSRRLWEDPDNYYEDIDWEIYYSFGFNWRDRNNPCKAAYYSPDRKVVRNILASNFGLIAKEGEDKMLHVMLNDLISALPAKEVKIDVYDYQMQPVVSGLTNQVGEAVMYCDRKPFLVIATRDKDRNYLKVNDGSSLSLSSFDVDGNKPDKGIKAFIYGERDVWRPGDTIFLSLFIKDMLNVLPRGHPVQMELINPMDQRVDNQVQKTNGSNLLVFTTTTSVDAVTGNYRAVFKIGGATFTKRIRIETVKPNRLKIKVSFPEEILGGSEPSAKGTLSVSWMNGAVAKNLKSTVDYLLKHTKTVFKKYGQYNFDDPVKDFYSETVRIFDGSLDGNGDAFFTFKPEGNNTAPGMLNAVFTTKVAEPGGDESIVQSSFKYAPYPVFAGINLPGLKGKSRMLFTDADNEVKIVTVDKNGDPVTSEVEINIYKISYRWWWESDQENLAYYISNNTYKPVITKNITTSAGEGSFTFNIDKKDWGRYLIRATLPSGHSTGKILLVDWPWEYGMKGSTDGATLLTISTDKEKYNPGDEVSLSFPSPENARAIVTLENATGIADEIRVPTGKGNTVVKFRARQGMAPNVYAYVSVIQPHAQTVNDMPVRLYGVVPVMIEDPATKLSPVIDMPDEVRSQKPFHVKISEADSKPMTYTLAVVDEGLLDITGFRTPDPWNYFFAREALGVKTWDVYDYVLGAFGGTLERIFAIGGDEALTDKAASKARRFPPVVRFMGPFTLGQGKTDIHTITLPQYTGSVKVMVVAGNENAFGSSEKSVLVRDPLMVLVTAPRTVSPGEKVFLPVSLFIQKEGIRDITLKVDGNDMISFDNRTMNIPVTETGERDTEFHFTAGEKTGVAKITVTASGGGEKATYNMEFEIRSPNPPVTKAETKILEKGKKWEISFKPFGLAGSNSANLEISSLPSINLEKRLDYLLGYPYGCTEQVTSAAFPQLWISELTGDNRAVAQDASGNVSAAIKIIVSRQMTNGGIALWPGALQADNWVTSYAGHFMTEAERKGYSIPSGFRQKWISYQTNTARNWQYDSRYKQTANDQAYRLFSLALAGRPERGAMNRLRETEGIPQLTRWLLAAAYAMTGRPEVAGSLLDMRNTSTEEEYQDYYYGSAVRDKAIILYTLVMMKDEELALPLLKELCDYFNSDSWFSTQTLAWGLLSYMKWTELLPAGDGNPSTATVIINGEKKEHNIADKELWSEDINMKDNNSISVENTAGKPMYITLVRKGVPVQGDVTREDKGLSMKIDYTDLSLKPVDQKNLRQGTDFLMIVRVTNNTFTGVDNIALAQMVPSGWEIQNTRMYEAGYGIKESSFDYRDFRDDRVNTFFSLGRGQTKTFVLVLNAAYKGEFYQPSVWCEAMYRAGCYSRYPGDRVKVTGNKLE